MRYEPPRRWPAEMDPDWGDLPSAASMSPSELARCEQATWRAFLALDIARATSLTTRSQSLRHQANRDSVHALAAALYARCRIRDERAGYG